MFFSNLNLHASSPKVDNTASYFAIESLNKLYLPMILNFHILGLSRRCWGSGTTYLPTPTTFTYNLRPTKGDWVVVVDSKHNMQKNQNQAEVICSPKQAVNQTTIKPISQAFNHKNNEPPSIIHQQDNEPNFYWCNHRCIPAGWRSGARRQWEWRRRALLCAI